MWARRGFEVDLAVSEFSDEVQFLNLTNDDGERRRRPHDGDAQREEGRPGGRLLTEGPGASEFGSGEIRRRRSDDDGEAAAAVVDGVLGSERSSSAFSGLDVFSENVDEVLLVAFP